ncbi:MAG: hypothetical protein ACOVRB_09790 [Akkermansiaceae bacterium]
MKYLFKTYGIIAISLLALFGSGVVVGRLTAPSKAPANQTQQIPHNAADWAEKACQALVRQLALTPDQEAKLRTELAPVSEAMHASQERALLQMHLRLLHFHDTLEAKGILDPNQAQLLSRSRVQLLKLIRKRFSPTLDSDTDSSDNSQQTKETP